MLSWDRSLYTNLPLLDESECACVLEGIDELRDLWVSRHPTIPFYTLGASNYFDIAYNPGQPYYAMAKNQNPLLRERFGWLYDRLAKTIGATLGAPATYPEQLALPGFHIFLAHEGLKNPRALMHREWFAKRDDPEVLSNPIHCDTPHLIVDWSGIPDVQMTHTISITLSIQLPASGAGLLAWDVYINQTLNLSESQVFNILQNKSPTYYPYTRGHFSLHSGLFYHQIAPASDIRPNDARITLQGHGLLANGKWQLYW